MNRDLKGNWEIGKKEDIASVGGTISNSQASAEPLLKKRSLAVARTGKLPDLEHCCFREIETDKQFAEE